MRKMFVKLFIFSLQFILILTQTGPVRPPFPDQTTADFQTQCLQAINTKRALHQNTPLLITNSDVVTYAQKRCQTASSYNFLDEGHAGLDGAHGENMYWGGYGTATPANCADAINMWYAEEQQYDYNNPGFNPQTGHFTQLVWAGTTYVGCARCGGKGSTYYEEYILCDFVTPGNVNTPAYFAANVNRKK